MAGIEAGKLKLIIWILSDYERLRENVRTIFSAVETLADNRGDMFGETLDRVEELRGMLEAPAIQKLIRDERPSEQSVRAEISEMPLPAYPESDALGEPVELETIEHRGIVYDIRERDPYSAKPDVLLKIRPNYRNRCKICNARLSPLKFRKFGNRCKFCAEQEKSVPLVPAGTFPDIPDTSPGSDGAVTDTQPKFCACVEPVKSTGAHCCRCQLIIKEPGNG